MKERHDDQIFKTEDLLEYTYAIHLTNTTTQTKLLPKDNVRIVEFRDSGITLSLPKNSCSKGHILMLDIIPSTNQKKIDKIANLDQTNLMNSDIMNLTVKVKHAEITEAGDLRAEVDFYQIQYQKWERFLAKYNSRQEMLTNIIKSVKE